MSERKKEKIIKEEVETFGFIKPKNSLIPINRMEAICNTNKSASEGVSGSVMSDSVILWTVACQAPLPMGFSRQEVGSHSLLQGIFQTQG